MPSPPQTNYRMSIVIENPELERILRERLETGEFDSIDGLLRNVLQPGTDEPETDKLEPEDRSSLVEFFRNSPLFGIRLDLNRG